MRKAVIISVCIGAVVIVIAGGLVVWHAGAPLLRGYFPFHISNEFLENPPISFEAGIEERIVPSIDPHTLFVNRPFGASNAAALYVEIFRSMNLRRETAALESQLSQPSNLTEEEFQIFLHAVEQAECDFSQESLVLEGKPVRLAPVVDISDNLVHLAWMREVALSVVARGDRYKSVENEEMAVRCYEGVVKFGSDIAKGRESLLQIFTGAAIQKSGAENLKRLYEDSGDTGQAQDWSDFLQSVDEVVARFKNKMVKLSEFPGPGPEAIANRLWILEHDKDSVFRREALVGLGAMRVFAPDVIDSALERTAEDDPDPYVREAARNALKLAEIPVTEG